MSLASSYKTTFVFVCLGGSGNILRPLRIKFGDDGGTGLQTNTVGLNGGEGRVIIVLVGLHPSSGIYFFSQFSLAIPSVDTPCKTVGEDLFEFV